MADESDGSEKADETVDDAKDRLEPRYLVSYNFRLAHHGPCVAAFLGVGFGCEGSGPSDIAVGGGVVGIFAFGEDPPGAGVVFAEETRRRMVPSDLPFDAGFGRMSGAL